MSSENPEASDISLTSDGSADEFEDVEPGEGEEEIISSLNEDLSYALSVADVIFSGKFYHISVEDTTPNPGLTIEGLGLIGLPLSEGTAKAIIAQAASEGFKTEGDTEVRDTWEIQPGNVSFANPTWQAFVDSIVAEKIWTSFDLGPYTTKPRCELYKLLLYQTGSHFLPHQDTSIEADGMFATVVIVLPSAFEGGAVHVSHAGQTVTLDVSAQSLFSTSVLAWYADVVHEVQPITSGYRLALSYNLIHTSSDTPAPSLPDAPEDIFEDLRETLQSWGNDEYEAIPEPPLVAHMLSHQYSQDDLARGAEALEGRDAQLVTHILPVIEEMDFVLCLANLNKRETGCPREYGYSRHKRCRCNGDVEGEGWDDGKTPSIGYVDEEYLELSRLIRINDNQPVDVVLKAFEINTAALVPQDAFKDLNPDERNYEGGQDNDAGTVEQWYRRSALVFFRKKDEISISMSIDGPEAMLHRLPLANTPTSAAKQIVAAVLEEPKKSSSAIILLRHATCWKDHELWNKAIPFVTPLDAITSAVADALKVFELDLIKLGLSKLIKRRSGLQRQLDVINAIGTNFTEGQDSAWIQGFIKGALSNYSAASAADVAVLVTLTQEVEGGFTTLLSTVIPRTKSLPNAFDFHVSLTEALDRHRRQLLNTDAALNETLRELVYQCLLAAASQWTTPPPPPPPPKNSLVGVTTDQSASPTVLARRVGALIKLCFSTENAEFCATIFNMVEPVRQMSTLIAIKFYIGNGSLTWLKPLMKTVVSTYSAPAVSHVDFLTCMAQEIGPQYIQSMIQKRISKSGTYEFFLALARSLHERLSLLSRSQSITDDVETTFRATIVLCVLSAIPIWEISLQNHASHGKKKAAPETGPNVKVKRIIELIEFCFIIEDLSPCAPLFESLLQFPSTNIAGRFSEVHTPLLTLIKETLAKHGKSITLEPFKSFFKCTISSYLGLILGAIPPAQPPPIPNHTIGCAQCAQCVQLNKWLSTSNPRIEFKAVMAIRSHLESYIGPQAGLGHLITYETLKLQAPHTLVISKRPEVLGPIRWKESQTAARRFLENVGDSNVLKGVMRNRYDDVNRAINGTKTFDVGSLAISDPTKSNGAASVVTPAAAPRIAGGKRKHQ